MYKVRTNTKTVVRFVNQNDINDFIEFLDENDISYDPDLEESNYPRFVSIGTSKKYTVGTSKNFDIYLKKGFNSYAYVDSSNNASELCYGNVDNFIEAFFETEEEETGDDEITLNSVPKDVVVALYNKVKALKQSPAKYFVMDDGNGSYKASR